MSLPGRGKRLLELHSDLPVSAEDIRAMRQEPSHQHRNPASYLDFLEETGAFDTQKKDVKIYGEMFEL